MSFRRILGPVDGSSTSDKAVAAAIDVAQLKGGSLRFLYCLDELALAIGPEFSGHVMNAAREEAQAVLARAQTAAKGAGQQADVHLSESPGKRIGNCVADEARDWNADLVVVGTHGRKGMARALLGSGAESIIREADVPVLVIRGKD